MSTSRFDYVGLCCRVKPKRQKHHKFYTFAALVVDDQVMDLIVEALHESHADEKRFREDVTVRLQEEQSKIQNRLDSLIR